MTTLEQRLKDVEKKVNVHKFNITAGVGDVPRHVNAYINILNWDVHITVDKDIEKSLKKIPKGMISSSDLLNDLLIAVDSHEIGHNTNPEGFFGCEGDERYFKLNTEGIKDALEELGVSKEKREALAPKIDNLFSDYVVNTSYSLRGKNKQEFRNGISAFYLLNSLKGFEKLMTHFVDLQFKTYWQGDSFKNIRTSMQKKDYDEKLVRDLIEIYAGKKELAEKIYENKASETEMQEFYEEINKKEKWNLKVYKFTKRIYELFKENEDKREQDPGQQGGSGPGQPGSSGSSGSGSGQPGNSGGGDSDSDDGEGSDSGSGDSQEQDNDSDDDKKDSDKDGSEKGNDSDKGDEKKNKKGKGDGSGDLEDKVDGEDNEKDGDGSGKDKGGKDDKNPMKYGPGNNYFTQKYEDDKKFRDEINAGGDDGEDGKGNNGQPKSAPSQAPQPKTPGGKGGGAGVGKGSSKLPHVPSIRVGSGGKIDPKTLEKIFQHYGNDYYDLPDDLLDEIRRNYNGSGNELQQIYEFYESLAERIRVVSPEKGNDESQKLPIMYMQRKEIDKVSGIPLDEIDFGGTRPLPNGEWMFAQKQLPITVDEEAKEDKGSTKDLCFIGDVSGSMGYAAPGVIAGVGLNLEHLRGHDNFNLMVHSVIKELKEREMGFHLRYSSVLFSDSTVFSGWKTYYELDDLFAFLYTGYQAGGTNFDARVLQQIAEQSTDKFLTIMLSDGGIANATQAANIVGNLIDAGNEFMFIEYYPDYYGGGGKIIHPQTEFGKFVKKKGADVHVITKPRDLFDITLGKARGMY